MLLIENDESVSGKLVSCIDDASRGMKASDVLKACIGLGCIIIMIEASRFSALYLVENSGIYSTARNLITCGALFIAALLYQRNDGFSLCGTGTVAVFALLLAFGFSTVYGGTQFPLARISIVVSIMDVLYRTSAALFLIAWIEKLHPYGSKPMALIFGLSLFFFGAFNIILLFMQNSAAIGVMTLLPIISAALMIGMGKVGDAKYPKADSYDRLIRGPWSMNSAYSILVSLSATVFFSVFIFKCVHSSWTPYQDGGSYSILVQLFAALGTGLAGVLICSMAQRNWSRSSINLCRSLILPFILLALFIAAKAGGNMPLYIIPLNIAQKTCLFLVVISPCWYEGTKRPLFCAAFIFGLYRLAQVSSLLYSANLNIAGVSAYDIVLYIALFVLIMQSIAILFDKRSDVQKQSVGKSEGGSAPLSEEEAEGEAASSQPVLDLEELRKRYSLTYKESELLELLLQGRSAGNISETLCVSVNTVKTHRRNIYAKLGIHSQEELRNLVYQEQ